MFLRNLSLVNYKNFDSQSFEFDAKINCFVGANGIGKTNILDAIYHLAIGKSYFNPMASQNIRHGEDFFMIEGTFEIKDRPEKVVCSFKRGVKKIIKRNNKVYERLSDHVGLVPLVIISPVDRNLILEGSDVRRKFIDSVISQSDRLYLDTLIKYNRTLQQRNTLLKYFALNHTFDLDTLTVYDEQLDVYGTEIFIKRKQFIEEFTPIFKQQYLSISGGKEDVSIVYDSKLKTENLKSLLQRSLEKDRNLQYSSVGIHKDDLLFEIKDYPVKKFGSQGQQKSFLIALKFAQFQFLKSHATSSPLLLLDDIFDKLDEHRVRHIITLVDEENFGQIFISDTHPERTEEIVKSIHQSYKIFKL
ncbi:DNA replication/repair protein RecF [Eudoraea chungangensis]|uniref:DNA replication/repair protein RecF n=1 Tax=Eudoraea chungangensis TaxID=1481905 RepID=UPI0023EA7FA9|nr:DNA replication and repair protein RecF [Eudoraea chungangensis]